MRFDELMFCRIWDIKSITSNLLDELVDCVVIEFGFSYLFVLTGVCVRAFGKVTKLLLVRNFRF